MPRLIFAPFLLLSALVLSACNPIENLGEAEDQIDRFHSLYSNGKADEMYLMGSRRFRDATPLATLEGTVSVVRERLGKVESSEREGFNVNTTTAGTTTIVTMKTRFELGEGTETYTFIGNGENMQIEGWNVTSPRLMIQPSDLNRFEEAETAE